jgi:hypothetical protein
MSRTRKPQPNPEPNLLPSVEAPSEAPAAVATEAPEEAIPAPIEAVIHPVRLEALQAVEQRPWYKDPEAEKPESLRTVVVRLCAPHAGAPVWEAGYYQADSNRWYRRYGNSFVPVLEPYAVTGWDSLPLEN